MKKRIKYTKEFKTEAVKLVTGEGYSQTEAAKGIGTSSQNIHRWVKESLMGEGFQNRKNRLRLEQLELQGLRRENKRLKLEREILKKAAAFFANASQ